MIWKWMSLLCKCWWRVKNKWAFLSEKGDFSSWLFLFRVGYFFRQYRHLGGRCFVRLMTGNGEIFDTVIAVWKMMEIEKICVHHKMYDFLDFVFHKKVKSSFCRLNQVVSCTIQQLFPSTPRCNWMLCNSTECISLPKFAHISQRSLRACSDVAGAPAASGHRPCFHHDNMLHRKTFAYQSSDFGSGPLGTLSGRTYMCVPSFDVYSSANRWWWFQLFGEHISKSSNTVQDIHRSSDSNALRFWSTKLLSINHLAPRRKQRHTHTPPPRVRNLKTWTPRFSWRSSLVRGWGCPFCWKCL